MLATEPPALATAFRLPSGAFGFGANRAEAEAMVEEVVDAGVYFRRGVGLPPTGHVVDVGANIGVFSQIVTASSECDVLALEPNPITFRMLSANLELWSADRVRAYCIGAGPPQRVEHFHVPFAAAQSGAQVPHWTAAPRRLRALGRHYLSRALRASDRHQIRRFVIDEVCDWYLGSEALTVDIVPMTECLRALPTDEEIALIKIDVEGAEWNVLESMSAYDLARTRSIVLEAAAEVVPEIRRLLEHAGFAVTAEVNPLIARFGVDDQWLVYATRTSRGGAASFRERRTFDKLALDDVVAEYAALRRRLDEVADVHLPDTAVTWRVAEELPARMICSAEWILAGYSVTGSQQDHPPIAVESVDITAVRNESLLDYVAADLGCSPHRLVGLVGSIEDAVELLDLWATAFHLLSVSGAQLELPSPLERP